MTDHLLPADSTVMAGVMEWALPFLDGDAPQFGSSAWLALPLDDPRRAAAVVRAALATWNVGDPRDMTGEDGFRAAAAADVDARGVGPSHDELSALRAHGDVEWSPSRGRYVPRTAA